MLQKVRKLARDTMEKKDLKSLLIGILLGFPIVLSFSGHFLFFWSRSDVVKYLIFFGLLILSGVLIGLLLNKSLRTRPKLTNNELVIFLILLCMILGFGLVFRSRIPLPLLPPTMYNMILTISGENTDATSYSKPIIGIRMLEAKSNRAISLSTISCDGDFLEAKRNAYYFELGSSEGKLRCSFRGNVRDAIIFIFLKPQNEGRVVETVFRSDAGMTTQETFYVQYSNNPTKSYGVLLPHTYFSIFCLLLDIISFAIILSLLIYVFFQEIRKLIPRVFILFPAITMLYLMIYPYSSGYIIGKDRTDFQLYRLPEYERMIRDVDRYVPEDASMVIVYPGKYPVSPLFGQNYTRRLLPQYPAPESISADYLVSLGAEYLLMSAELFEKDKLEPDGQLHFVIYGGGEVLYPNYSLYGMLKSGLIIVASCVKQPDCLVRYYIFSVQR
ncbi:MAG: hypothetical protein HS100_10960 [Anaerolineales bacterium]|nr:hypothetical protein [Anaerolineales bacterium]